MKYKKLDSIIDILHSHLYFVKDEIIEKIANEIVVLDFPAPKGCSADCMYCKHFKNNGILNYC